MRRPMLLAVSVAAVAGLGAALGSSAGPAAQTESDMAQTLVDRWISSVGGMETFWGLQSAEFTLTTEMYDASTGRLRRTRPRYVSVSRTESGEAARIERWEGDDFIVQRFDGGDGVWATMNGEVLSPGDKDHDETVYVSRDVFYWIRLPFKLKDPGVFLHYDGVDDEGLHKVRVTFGENVGEHDDTWFYTFKDGQTLPVQIAYREEGRENINLTRWDDIQEVGGYMFAGRRISVNDRGEITKIIVTSDFVLNPDIDQSRFRLP